MSSDYNQWSTVRPFFDNTSAPLWVPPEDRDRLQSYLKYDQMYWNDPRQYPLRVLEGEQPIYIPNARIIVDTTAYFLLKGLKITYDGNKDGKKYLEDFLKRETFYSSFATAKQAGVARGDFAFHMTANPRKGPGLKISLNTIDPSMVFPIYDDDEPDKMVGCSIAVQYMLDGQKRLRRLTYRVIEDEASETPIRISREEGIYELSNNWYGKEAAKLIKQTIPKGLLDARITSIPIYWFRNRSWDGEDFGSSELRGVEAILEQVSQGSTDVSAALSLEGLGVYATDGGRPVMDDGAGGVIETDWEVAPGRVMEVPSGAYFRRIEGVHSITPATDQIDYLETKAHESAGLNEISLGSVEAPTAASGIALAIKFMPTLAKLEVRDQHGIDVLTQLFYDWKTWVEVFERKTLDGDIIPVIGDKLPTDRVAKLNELNNMMDRKVISAAYYRSEMEALGYKFPSDAVMEQQIADDVARTTPTPQPTTDPNAAPPTDPNAQEVAPPDQNVLPDGQAGKAKTTQGNTLPTTNRSNNKNRPNESAGTEAVQKATK